MNFPRIVTRTAPTPRALPLPSPQTSDTIVPPHVAAELRAMRICYAELSGLDSDAQRRAIEWVQRQLETQP